MTNATDSNNGLWAKYLAMPQRKAFAAALIALIVLTGIWWAGHLWYRNTLHVDRRAAALAEIDTYGNALTIDLRRRFDLIFGLRAWLTTKRSMADLSANFGSFARQLLSQEIAGIRGLTIAPGGVTQMVYPLAGNESILGRNLLADPRAEVREDVARAISTRKAVISGPHELVAGGFSAVARLAIFRDESFWGVINLALDIPPILEEAGLTKQKNLQLALRDGRGRVFFGAPAVFDSEPLIHRIDLPDGHWELGAIPIMGWSAAVRRDLRIFDAGALISVLLLSFIAYLLAFRDARLALRVEEATGELSTELQRRRTVEAELRAAEARYHTLVQVNPDAVLVNFNKKIVYANLAAARILGAAAPEDLLGRSPFDFVEAERRAEVEQRYERALASGQPNQPNIQRRVRLNGSIIHVETVAAPLAWDGGSAVQVIMRDVTDQRKAEAWVRSLIDTTQDAVISIDRQGRIALFNPAAERIFGYKREEAIGQKVNLLMAEPYTSEHDGYIERYERTGEAHAIGRIRTVMAKRKNGESFPIELSVAKVPSDQEVQYGAFIRDISDKVKLQAQAVENERLATIGTMAAKFGHELGNPLNGMSLTIQLLEQRLKRLAPELDDQASASLARLKSEIARLNSLLQDFRSLSRKETFSLRPTTLSALVTEAIEIELPRYVEQRVEVELSFPPALPPVKVDIDKMKQVILNLAKNAVEAMPNGGKLSFNGSASDGVVTLNVSDTGIGIAAETDIFEPFFTTKPFGTGIGMTIVRQIVQGHGGSVSYQSEPGKGTTFSVSVPRG